jgi:N-acetyl-anhydromuramyl-L-alanine amidase AmpD
MKYSIIRVIRHKNGKNTYYRARGRNGKTVFGYADFKRISSIYRKRGLEYRVHHIPRPKPVAAPNIAVNMSQRAAVVGVNKRLGVVLHSTESHDRPGTSDMVGVNLYLINKGYGIHYIVDGDGLILKGAHHRDMVYHCAGANQTHIGIEMIGFARWSTRRWLWDPTATGRKQRAQVNKVARLVAYICDKEGIPIRRHVTNGISLHVDHPEGGHWDPGPGFPVRYVINRAHKIQNLYRNPAPSPKPPSGK